MAAPVSFDMEPCRRDTGRQPFARTMPTMHHAAAPLHVCFDAFELDEANARLTRDGTPVPLQPNAFDLLCALARRSGQLTTKAALLDAVWGDKHVGESVLKATISQLRAALDDDARQPRVIETASRRGYRFLAPVRPAVPVPAGAVDTQQLARLAGELRALLMLLAAPQPSAA